MQNTTNTTTNTTKMTFAEAVAARKLAKAIERQDRMAEDESLVDLAASKESQGDWVTSIRKINEHLENISLISGVKRDWDVRPAYEYGPLGELKKFLTLWVYLPDTLKDHSKLQIPHSAFTSDDLLVWGTIPYCTRSGEVKEANYTVESDGDFGQVDYLAYPDLQQVEQQCKLLNSVYLQLEGEMPPVLTELQWQAKAIKGLKKAIKMQGELREAEAEEAKAKASGKATFTL